MVPIGSATGLGPNQHQAIIWTTDNTYLEIQTTIADMNLRSVFFKLILQVDILSTSHKIVSNECH